MKIHFKLIRKIKLKNYYIPKYISREDRESLNSDTVIKTGIKTFFCHTL
jgi:hypothetical protein